MDKLQQKRDEAAVKMRSLIDVAKKENRGMTSEERNSYDLCLAAIQEVDQIRKAEKETAEIEATQELEARMINTLQKATPAEIDYFSRFVREGNKDGLEYRNESRSMSSSSGSTGGFLVPENYAKTLREYMSTDNVIRQLATVEQWASDGAFPVVSSFGTSYLVGEGGGVTETTVTIGQKTITGYQFMYAVDVPVALLNKSAYPLESKLMQWMAKSITEKQEDYFADGSGSGEPMGLVDGATQGTATAANGAIAADDVMNWYRDVPFKYRKNATWLMNDASIGLIAKIKNSVTTSGALNYVNLFVPGLGGAPDTILGRPVYPSAGFASLAAGEEIGVFGDISQYIIADFGAPTLIRDPYTKAKYNEVSFVGCYITDTALPVAEAVRTLKITS